MAWPGEPVAATIDDTLTMRPKRARIMGRSARLVVR
jgi:hypothetical protein